MRVWLWGALLALGACDEGTSDSIETDTDTDGGTDTEVTPGGLPDLYINEFMATNSSGYYLTDDLADARKWAFGPGVEIAAGEYMIVWADSDPEEGELHTTFNLNADGDALALLAPDADGNELIDAIEAYPAQVTDVSWARTTDGGADWAADDSPTPGASNN